MSEEVCKHKQLEAHLRATLASMSDAVVTTDCRGRIVYLNPAAQILLERNDQELAGCMISDALELMATQTARSLAGAFQAAICDNEFGHLPRRVILTSRTGGQHAVEQSTSCLLDAHGIRIGAVISFRRWEITTPRPASPKP